MTIKNSTLSLATQKELEIIDITKKVESIVAETEINNGIANIQSMHTTASVVVNENEPLLLEDFKNHLEEIAPKEQNYRHDNFGQRTVNLCDDECANGHAHCKALHLPANVCLNIINGMLQLGAWQRILFIELDRPKQRKAQVQVIGE